MKCPAAVQRSSARCGSRQNHWSRALRNAVRVASFGRDQAVAPGPSRLVQKIFGTAYEHVGILVTFEFVHAEAASDPRNGVEARSGDLSAQTLCKDDRLAQSGVGSNDQEFLAPVACQPVETPQFLAYEF